jgi:protein-disulfide isomerase
MDRRFVGMLVVCALVLGGIFWFTRKPAPANSGTNKTTSSKPGLKSVASDHTLGAGKSGVELIEYGDYQCPACGSFYPILKQVTAKYGDGLKFVFRNFPLDSIHQNARAGARAAEAAGLQNKFWEMHDMLYEQQQNWSSSTNPEPLFEDYARNLGLDVNKFKQDYASGQVNKIINTDVAAGQDIKASSTPTFVLDGKMIDSETQQTLRPAEAFEKYIDAEIAKKNGGAANVREPAPAPAPTPAPTNP